MEKLKIYMTPSMEILAYAPQNIMKISGGESDLPDDPNSAPAPPRRTEVF